MKVMKIEILVLDFDDTGEDGVKDVIENSHYPNRCISPKVMNIQSVDVDWSDSNPLNNTTTTDKAYKDLFGITEPPHN